MLVNHFFVLILFVTTLIQTSSFKPSSLCRTRLYTLSNTPLPDTNASLKKALKKENNILWDTLTSKAKQGIKWLHTQRTMHRATKIGFPWKEYYDLGVNNKETLYKNYFDINNYSMVYPDYYTQKFHYYDEGNLNWEAAFEVVPTTTLIASRYWPLVDVPTAQEWMRGNTTNAIQQHIIDFDSPFQLTQNTGRIMDVGCSGGISTKFLIEAFPDKEIDAVDLSPYFLSVAALDCFAEIIIGRACARPVGSR